GGAGGAVRRTGGARGAGVAGARRLAGARGVVEAAATPPAATAAGAVAGGIDHRGGEVPAERVHHSEVGGGDRIHHARVAEGQKRVVACAFAPVAEVVVRIVVEVVEVGDAVVQREIAGRGA